MTLTLAKLILAAALTGQHPPSGSPAAPALSADEVVRLESAHLTNIRQVTYGFSRAGEGYFSPDGHSIIFQAVSYLAPSIFHHPKPDEDGYQIYTGVLDGGFTGQDGEHGQRSMHVSLLSPERQVDFVCLDPLEPEHGRRHPQKAQPIVGRSVIVGSSRNRWTFSRRTSMERTCIV